MAILKQNLTTITEHTSVKLESQETGLRKLLWTLPFSLNDVQSLLDKTDAHFRLLDFPP